MNHHFKASHPAFDPYLPVLAPRLELRAADAPKLPVLLLLLLSPPLPVLLLLLLSPPLPVLLPREAPSWTWTRLELMKEAQPAGRGPSLMARLEGKGSISQKYE